MKELKKHIAVVLELGKVRITFFVAFSTSVGYILSAAKIEFTMLFAAAGVFLLACGSSALNHYQERKYDALMDRTKGRPIPSQRVNANYAISVSIILCIAGLAIVYFSSNLTALVLGIIALVWYNLIYTPLKRGYALAVVPGSVIGAIPPMIGWAAAGGNVFDMKVISLAFFFFIWQIPHFWLLLLIYGKDYEQAGFPTLTKLFSNFQLGRITFAWIAALATSCMLIPFFNFSINLYTVIFMMLLGFGLLWKTKDMLSEYIERALCRKIFLSLNLYVLIVSLAISIDKLFLKEI